MWGRKGRGLFHTIRHRNLVNTQSIPGKHFQEGSSTLPHRHISLPDPQISPGSLLNPISCNQLLPHLDPRDDLLQCLSITHRLEFLSKDHSTEKVRFGQGHCFKNDWRRESNILFLQSGDRLSTTHNDSESSFGGQRKKISMNPADLSVSVIY